MVRRRNDLTGKRFGRLVVESIASLGKKNVHVKWNCRCDCGSRTVVPSNGLKSGNNTQCFSCARASQRSKVRASNNGRWRGGLSFGKYCHKFNDELKEEIREEQT